MTYLLSINPPLSSAFGKFKKIVTCYMIYNYKNISKLPIFLWEYVLQGMETEMSSCGKRVTIPSSLSEFKAEGTLVNFCLGDSFCPGSNVVELSTSMATSR